MTRPALSNISQWFRDAHAAATAKPVKSKDRRKKNRGRGRKGATSTDEESDQSESEEEEEVNGQNGQADPLRAEQMRQFEVRKKFLTSKIPPFGVNRGQKASVLSTHIDSASAQLIVRYLSSKRPFANSFDKYLSGTMAT